MHVLVRENQYVDIGSKNLNQCDDKLLFVIKTACFGCVLSPRVALVGSKRCFGLVLGWACGLYLARVLLRTS